MACSNESGSSRNEDQEKRRVEMLGCIERRSSSDMVRIEWGVCDGGWGGMGSVKGIPTMIWGHGRDPSDVRL